MISTATDRFLEINKKDNISPSLLWQAHKVVIRGDIISYTRVNKAKWQEQEKLSSIFDIDRQYSASSTPELYKIKLDLQTK